MVTFTLRVLTWLQNFWPCWYGLGFMGPFLPAHQDGQMCLGEYSILCGLCTLKAWKLQQTLALWLLNKLEIWEVSGTGSTLLKGPSVLS